MQPYEKTIWIDDETYLNEENMNKIENQLETLTNNAISESNKGYVTNEDLESKNYATETTYDIKIDEAFDYTGQLSADDKAKLGTIMTNARASGKSAITLNISYSDDVARYLIPLDDDIQKNPFNVNGKYGFTADYFNMLTMVCLWGDNNTCTVPNAQVLKVNVTDSNTLHKDNIWEYTPTGDYNPSTKKYVDDSIQTAIGDALGGNY